MKDRAKTFRLAGLSGGAVLMCLIGSSGNAAQTGWTADCQLAGGFGVRFETGPNGEDMNVHLERPDRPPLALSLAPAIFHRRGVVANQASGCDQVGAYLLPDQIHRAAAPRLLLWLSVDDRPGFDLLSLVLVDLEAGKVLDRSERIAPIKDADGQQRLTLHIADDHALVRLQRHWLYNTGTDSAENSIEDWYRVDIRAGRIRGRWADRVAARR